MRHRPAITKRRATILVILANFGLSDLEGVDGEELRGYFSNIPGFQPDELAEAVEALKDLRDSLKGRGGNA